MRDGEGKGKSGMELHASEIRGLKKRAAQLRGNLIDMIPAGKVGHLGGSSSIMDVVAALYFKEMNLFDGPKDPRRDRTWFFSKGHAVLAQYAAFVELGYVDRAALCTRQDPGRHTSGASGYGSYARHRSGHGLSGAGAFRLRGHGARPFAWTKGIPASTASSETASRRRVRFGKPRWRPAPMGLITSGAIVDVNGVQATDAVEKVLANPNLKQKWEAFGWKAIEIDGHDMNQILCALEEAEAGRGSADRHSCEDHQGQGLPLCGGKGCLSQCFHE